MCGPGGLGNFHQVRTVICFCACANLVLLFVRFVLYRFALDAPEGPWAAVSALIGLPMFILYIILWVYLSGLLNRLNHQRVMIILVSGVLAAFLSTQFHVQCTCVVCAQCSFIIIIIRAHELNI